MNGFPLDLRCAVRGLLRSPAMVLTTVGCLGLGIGATGALLDLLDRLLWSPPDHVARADQLVRPLVEFEFPGMGKMSSGSFSVPTFEELSPRLGSLAAYHQTETSVGRGEQAISARAVLASPGYFELLGVRPRLGGFSGSDGAGFSGRGLAVLGDGFWHRGYGGDPEVLGRELQIGTRSYTVIGIAPEGFHGVDLEPVDLWLSLDAGDELVSQGWQESGGTKVLGLVARLDSDSDVDRASHQATALFQAINEGHPIFSSARVVLEPVMPVRSLGHRDVTISLWVGGIAVIMLVIACLSVSTLFLVRMLRRRQAIGIRKALGAGRFVSLRQTLVECWLLAALGGALAIGVAWIGGGPLAEILLAADSPWGSGLGARSVAGVGGVVLLAGFLCSLFPLAYGLVFEAAEALRGAAGAVPGRRLRKVLLASQVALTVALLIGAGLFWRSFRNAVSVDLGFDAQRVLVATMDLEAAGFAGPAAEELYRRALERVRSLPMIDSASLAAGVPLESISGTELVIPGHEDLPQLPGGGPYLNAVGEGFFHTLGIGILRGSGFEGAIRGGEPMVVLNEAAAEAFWPGEEALGSCPKPEASAYGSSA